MNQPIDINSLTLEQAESFAYRELVKIEAAQKNLQVLNQIIAQRNAGQVEVKTETKETKKKA